MSHEVRLGLLQLWLIVARRVQLLQVQCKQCTRLTPQTNVLAETRLCDGATEARDAREKDQDAAVQLQLRRAGEAERRLSISWSVAAHLLDLDRRTFRI